MIYKLPAKHKGRYVTVRVDRDTMLRFGPKRLSVGSHGYVQFWDAALKRTLLFHREIMGMHKGDGKIVDHKNGDKLDCRRSNLRVVDPSGSSQNVAPHGASGIRNVFSTKQGKWSVRIKYRGRIHNFGTYADLSKAEAVAKKERKRLLPFAVDR